MANVNDGEKDAMKAILQAMNGFEVVNENAQDEVLNESDVDHIPVSDMPVSASGQAMKEILQRLNASTNTAVDMLTETATTNDKLSEALVTQRTSRGARIGSWEIVKHGNSSYDVVHVDTNEPIAKNLLVYEAAYGIAKNLNAGKTITDKAVRDLLLVEENFSRNRQNALQHKHQKTVMEQRGNTMKAAIAEDRLDEAQAAARADHERLLKLAGLL